jgi:hypothetical protein
MIRAWRRRWMTASGGCPRPRWISRADAPAAEPGGLPTLSAADFKREFDGTTAGLASLRGREIVRHDLPQITEETGKLTAAIQLLEQRVEATLALLNPETWLANVAKAHGNFAETKRRWAAWQATVANLTAAALRADRPRLRQLRAQERQVKEWIDGLEGPGRLAALAVPALDTATPETASELRRLEAVRREQTAVAPRPPPTGATPCPPRRGSAASAAVRAPLEAHRAWLEQLPAFAAGLDRLSQLLTAGFGWTEGVSEVVGQLARQAGIDDLTGPPAEWNTEAKQLARLVDNSDRAVLTAAAQSGGLSRKLMAWRRLGTLAGWPGGAEDFDLDGGVVKVMRELVGRDVPAEPRRTSLLEEMVRETRLRFNRAARTAARADAQLTAMFERMQPAGVSVADLDEPVAYNLALWRLKRSDWNESNLDRLRVRRDDFVTAVRAIKGIASQPAVGGLLETLTGIELKDDPNRPPTPSPRLAGWQEELTNEGLNLTATWTGGGKKGAAGLSDRAADGRHPAILSGPAGSGGGRVCRSARHAVETGARGDRGAAQVGADGHTRQALGQAGGLAPAPRRRQPGHRGEPGVDLCEDGGDGGHPRQQGIERRHPGAEAGAGGNPHRAQPAATGAAEGRAHLCRAGAGRAIAPARRVAGGDPVAGQAGRRLFPRAELPEPVALLRGLQGGRPDGVVAAE